VCGHVFLHRERHTWNLEDRQSDFWRAERQGDGGTELVPCGEQNGVADADINLVHTAAWKSRVLTDAEWLQVITDKSTYRLNQIVGAAMIHQVDWNAKVGGTTYDDLSPINSDSNSITGSAIDAVYDAPWTPGLGSPVDMVMKPGRPGLFDPDLNVEAWF
jgi:hypothetical protein